MWSSIGENYRSVLAVLSQILDAAVDANLLDRNPMRRKSRAGRDPLARAERVRHRLVWFTRPEVDAIATGAAAIEPRYGAQTGGRIGELQELRLLDLSFQPYNGDGAIESAAGSWTIGRAWSTRSGNDLVRDSCG